MEWLLFVSVFISFFSAFLILPKWIKKCHQTNLLWQDMNKFDKPKNVAASGGLVVIMAFVLGVLFYIAVRSFVFNDLNRVTIQIFALLSSVLVLSIVGLTDDLLGWQHGGLSKRFRVFLAIFAAVPLIVINAGDSVVNLGFASFNFGLIYPLIFIPIGIVGCVTTYNFLAGFNGLESGQGILILSYLSFVAYFTGNAWLSVIGLCMVGALIAFYFYNKFPAKVFPGDILTWSVGALIAGMAILGNFEKIAIFIFIPYIVEFFLKLRGGLKKSSFGIPQKDGSLKMPYDKVYGLTHLSILILSKFKKKVYEKDVVYFIFLIELVFILLSMFML